MTAVLARPLPGRAAQRQPGTVERGVVWGGAAGACVGAAVGTGLGFVIGFAVGAAVGWIAGACLGLAGGLALCLPRAAVSPLRARVVAGLVPALVVGAVFVRIPGTWVAASAFAATCLAVGAAVGPTVAFGPAPRPTRPGRPGQPGQPWAPYGPGVLLLGAVIGAPVGAVAGLQA
ncbi:MAG: hypothetical protein INR67_11940, partial [Jatrophihabitans endophyticus]|nr:hypothetical protein [Jatrophihabitans endophyticus]